LQSGNSSHVSGAVCSPVTYKTQYFWFKFMFNHPYSTPKSVCGNPWIIHFQ
jgi:hypothetical protein